MADTIQPRVVQQETTTSLSWDLALFPSPPRPHLSEALLCIYCSILEKLSKGNIRPVTVTFTHEGPDGREDRAAYERYFNAPVHFASGKNELIIDSRDLDIGIELADASLFTVLERHAELVLETMPGEKRWSGRVARQISKGISSGSVPTLDTVARELAVSRRSLQERLQNEDACFRRLVDKVRRQVAIDRLSDPNLSICDVAFLLGYSDQSAFNHAFKRWTGKSPKAFRKG